MTSLIVDAVRSSLDRRMTVRRQGDSTVVATAWTLEDGTPVTLYINELADGLYNVSDAGLAAEALADAGVDLDNKIAGSSFRLVQQGLRLSPWIGGAGRWDLALSATLDDLGDAIFDLSEAVIRAEGLKALARRRPARTFGDRIVRIAAEAGLQIEPQARIPLRYKNASRRVAYHLIGAHRDLYMQSITRASTLTGYDHARTLFSDSSIAVERRMTAIEGGVQLVSWQYEGLSEVCQVITEDGMGKELAKLAAA